MSDNDSTPTIPREAAEQMLLRAILYLTESGGPTADVLNLCRAHAALTGREGAARMVSRPGTMLFGGTTATDEVREALKETLAALDSPASPGGA